MPVHQPDPLGPLGWTDRVSKLWRDVADTSLRPGRVVRVERGLCHVAVGASEEHRLPAHGQEAHGQAAVGDWVATTPKAVERVLPRWSALTRRDPAASGIQAGVQVLAANVDVVLVTVPADRPSAARVEREVTAGWESGAVPLVVVTKSDLDAGGVVLESLRARLAGADVVATSATTGAGLPRLRSELGPGRTGVLLGPSGAGKSTLVNALFGGAVQAVGEVRSGDARGRHTTTSRQLVCLPCGGVLIDTPGLRSLGLVCGAGVDDVFPEIELLARDCRFRDCGHEHEPGCAVLGAVSAGMLDPGRLESFKKLVREVAAERRRSDPLAAREARRAWSQRATEARRYDKRRLR